MTPGNRVLIGTGGGRAITTRSGELVIATRSKTQYLGYELQSPAVAAAAARGHLLVGLGESLALLDRELRSTLAPALSIPPGSLIANMRWLGADDWLVQSVRSHDGVVGIDLVDVVRRTAIPIHRGLTAIHALLHEPSTQLVTISRGTVGDVRRYDPATHQLTRLASLANTGGDHRRAEVIPVAPDLAGGTQVVVIHTSDRLTIRWVRDPRVLDKGTTVTIDGALAAVDSAGHVFVWQNDPKVALELVVFADGKRTSRLATGGPTAIFPHPKGTQLVQVGPRMIALVALDATNPTGTQLWARPLQGVTEALWLADGTLGIVSNAGIARLDPASGEVIAARCGWKFGLSAKPHPASSRFEPICTQLR